MERKLVKRLELLSPDDLKPGDIFLSRGCDWIASLISEIDGSRYSHAGIWTGQGVVEAVSDGIWHRTLEKSLEYHPRGFLHVYRPSRSVRTAELVAEAAARFASDNPAYAWGDLLLASLLAAINPTPLGRDAKEAAKVALAGSLSKFRLFLEQKMPDVREALSAFALGKEGCMTCSQLVAVAFADAARITGDDPLRLTVSGDRWVRSSGPLQGMRGADELELLRQQIAALAQPLLDAQVKGPGSEGRFDPLRDRIVHAAYSTDAYPPHLVSPRDVFSSPDLEPLGRIDLVACGLGNCTALTGTGDADVDQP